MPVEKGDYAFEYEDYIVFRSLLNGFTICDRYYVTGFMQYLFDRPLLCQSGHVDSDPLKRPPDVKKWNTKELSSKWRGSNLKELGLLEYITILEIMPEKPRTVEGISEDGSTGFRMTDAPKYVYYVYSISDKGREAAKAILDKQF